MRIECPHCKASGTINDHTIPEEGMYLSCPRCKEGFQVNKPRRQMTSAYATNTCPSCGYSTYCEEVFDQCPKCGVVVKTLMERKLEQEARRREQELMGQHPGVPIPPPPVSGSKYLRAAVPEETPRLNLNLAGFANGFDPVAAVGWGAVLVAVVLLVIGIMGVMNYHGNDIQARLSELSVEEVSAWQVFWGYGFMPWLETLFGAVALVAALGFLQRSDWGARAMEGVVLAGLVLAPLYELVVYGIWVVKSIDPPWWAYLVEFFSAILFAALWMAPLLALLYYLRGDRFRYSYASA